MEITLREYQKQDYTVLRDVIRKTWKYDEFAGPKTAEKLADVFLRSCLANQTFSRVAVDHGKPVGIILVKNIAEYKCPLKYKLSQYRAIASLLFSREGRKVSKIFESVNGIDKQLIRSIGKDYPAEIALFAVDASCRGKGIGKILFTSALDYLKKVNAEEFYLFTDTSCNYGFYEHQGMKRRGEMEHVFEVQGQKAKMNFFLYDSAVFYCE